MYERRPSRMPSATDSIHSTPNGLRPIGAKPGVGPPTYSEQYGTRSSVVRMHSGNGLHEKMDRRAIDCFDRAMDDVNLIDPVLRRGLHAYFA